LDIEILSAIRAFPVSAMKDSFESAPFNAGFIAKAINLPYGLPVACCSLHSQLRPLGGL
jgi:hypothetical protein